MTPSWGTEIPHARAAEPTTVFKRSKHPSTARSAVSTMTTNEDPNSPFFFSFGEVLDVCFLIVATVKTHTFAGVSESASELVLGCAVCRGDIY